MPPSRLKRNLFSFIGISAVTALTFKLFYGCFAPNIPSSQLISIHLISRHGARTPINIISGLQEAEYKVELLEPFVKSKYILKTLENLDFHDKVSFFDQMNLAKTLKGGAGRGQLTKIGEKQCFELGRRIRKKYIEDLKFLSNEYDPNELYMRSSHYRRTINSAKSVLAGIYAKSPDSEDHTFIINVNNLHEDYIFPNHLDCPYFAGMHKLLEKLNLYTKNKEYMENLNALNKTLQEIDKNANTSFTVFRDDIMARKTHGLPYPTHLEELFQKSDRYANMELTSQNDHSIQISCGQFLNLIKNNLLTTVNQDTHGIEQTKYHKFKMYSAHDSSLNAILVALDYYSNDDNHVWPPFAADLAIELWKQVENEKNRYFIKIFYCGEEIFLPSCHKNGKECHFNDFIKVLEKNSVDRTGYKNLCERDFIVNNLEILKEDSLINNNNHQTEISIVEEEIETSYDTTDQCFISLHIGAGFHSIAKTGAYRALCEKICEEVMVYLKKGVEARKAVAYAIELLENSPLTNAGLGSNLTLDEKIECDASIMDSSGFGSVGAVSNIKNPIKISLSLLEAQSKGTLSLGRIVPCMLVGDGARKWAKEHNIEEIDEELLKTENIIKSHRHYKNKLLALEKKNELFLLENNEKNVDKTTDLNKTSTTNSTMDNALNCINNSKRMFDHSEMKKNDETISLDTVGAIVLDTHGRFASAVSSGGILLKYPGRIGHSSMFGCGCWVDEANSLNEDGEKESIAICTTGCGEYIIKTLFAKSCAQHILNNYNKDETQYNLNEFFKKHFFNAHLLRFYEEKLIGTMILELLVAHTTPSMCFGYMLSDMKKPISVMSRLKEDMPNQNAKESVLISSFRFKLRTESKEIINESNDGFVNENKKKNDRATDFVEETNKKPKV